MKFKVGDNVIINPKVFNLLKIYEIFGNKITNMSLFKIKDIDYSQKPICVGCGNIHKPEITIFSIEHKEIEISMTECELEFSLDEKINKLLEI